jgi:hypothetical protein
MPDAAFGVGGTSLGKSCPPRVYGGMVDAQRFRDLAVTVCMGVRRFQDNPGALGDDLRGGRGADECL